MPVDVREDVGVDEGSNATSVGVSVGANNRFRTDGIVRAEPRPRRRTATAPTASFILPLRFWAAR